MYFQPIVLLIVGGTDINLNAELREKRGVCLCEGSEKQEETNYVEGKCCYEILGVKTPNEGAEESNFWQGIWFETNQFMCLGGHWRMRCQELNG
jgi:hypothetical protein